MAFKLAGFVRDTTVSTGDTGTIALDQAAIDGFRAFADVFSDNDTTIVARDDDDGVTGATEREVLHVQYDSANDLLTVLAVIESTNGGARVDWPAGTTNIFVVHGGGSGISRDSDGHTRDGVGDSIAKEAVFDNGTKTTGTFTPEPSNGAIQKAVNGGAHTLAPPTETGCFLLYYTNNGSAGTITTSSFGLVLGDAPGTTNTDRFEAAISYDGVTSVLQWTALQ